MIWLFFLFLFVSFFAFVVYPRIRQETCETFIDMDGRKINTRKNCKKNPWYIILKDIGEFFWGMLEKDPSMFSNPTGFDQYNGTF